MRNISHKVEEREEATLSEAVGLDLYSSFQQQEFTDFEIVCEDRNLHCHKVVLAARSPVFRLIPKSFYVSLAQQRAFSKSDSFIRRLFFDKIITGQCC